jgi:hypothetical protein
MQEDAQIQYEDMIDIRLQVLNNKFVITLWIDPISGDRWNGSRNTIVVR